MNNNELLDKINEIIISLENKLLDVITFLEDLKEDIENDK